MPDLCNKMSEPSPYAILLNCLQRNYGLGDTNITTDLSPARNRKYNKFSMTVNEKTVEVLCRSKRDGKQTASQKLLQLLHPNLKSWGSLLKLYGSRATQAQKNKKEKESEVSPNTVLPRLVRPLTIRLTIFSVFLLTERAYYPRGHTKRLFTS